MLTAAAAKADINWAAELSQGINKPTAEEAQAESRRRWLEYRDKNPPKLEEERQRQGREDWLKLRELIAQGDASAQERALVAMEFQGLARSRAADQDKADGWEATPKSLRDAIERYNREPPAVQREILKAIVMRPETAKAPDEGIREREKTLDRGPSLEL